MTFTIKPNPRYEAGQFEEAFMTHPEHKFTVPYPRRYDSPEDWHNGRPSIPPLLKMYEDGTTEEVF